MIWPARLLVPLLLNAPAAADGAPSLEVSDDERREAGCIDYYNDPEHVDPDEVAFRRNSALVRLRAEGLWGGASGGASAVVRGTGYGARVDVDLPVLALLSLGPTDTGFSSGLSGATSFVPDRGRSTWGELRLGVARRRYGVTWSSISDRCRRQRVDLGLDLLRWRAGAFTDLSLGTHPTTFVSSVGFPGILYRRMYPTWGLGATASLVEFRLAPSFQWGANGGLEFYVWHVLVGLTAGFHFLPDFAVSVALGLGGELEVGGGT